jgi:Immunoglobulin domain
MAFDFGEESVNAGDFSSVHCAVIKGDSPVAITWYFNHTEFKRLVGVNVIKSGARSQVLNIEHVKAAHSGPYTCVATNAAGSTNHTAVLIVNGDLVDLNYFPLVCYAIFIISCLF